MPIKHRRRKQNLDDNENRKPDADPARHHDSEDEKCSQVQTVPHLNLEYFEKKLTEEGRFQSDEEKFELANQMYTAYAPWREVQAIIDQIDPQQFKRLMEEAELRRAEVKVTEKVNVPDGGILQTQHDDTDISGNPFELGGKVLAPFTFPEKWMDPPPLAPLRNATFVRALRDSVWRSKPEFSKGDILRKIGLFRRGDPYFEVLHLKPPGEVGRVLRIDFEEADEEAAHRVGREAKTEKEKEIFQSAMDWED